MRTAPHDRPVYARAGPRARRRLLLGEHSEVDLEEYGRQVDEHRRLSGREAPPGDDGGGARGLTRRDLLVKGGVGAAAVAGLGAMAGTAAARTSSSGKFTGTLRVLTLGVEWPAGVQQQAEKDLGFKFVVTPASSFAQVQKVITAPDSFDIFGGYNYQDMQAWPSHNLLPIDTQQIKAWPNLYKLFAYGKLNPGSANCTYGDGDAPFRSLFLKQGTSGLPLSRELPAANKEIVQWIDESTGKPHAGKPMPRYIVGIPAHFNMDSMGYLGDVIKLEPSKVSWTQLLNPKWKGRVALLNDPGIALQDAGNAVKALGLMKFKDLGNMTKAEIDGLIKIMISYKKKGQFRAFWSTFNESVNLMSSKEVVIESMWSPAVALLVAQGVNVRYASPPEGFRGWCSAQGISAKVTDSAKLQACYDYLNWMYDGFLGAAIMRQGYYIGNGNQLLGWINTKGKSTPFAGHAFAADEYDFWYGGKPAARDLPGITGHVGDVKKGQVRDGGSFAKRACHYSSWNSYFREGTYQVKRFNDFTSA
jgi:putative spermidine/putrescine transport system substrate-binding protein